MLHAAVKSLTKIEHSYMASVKQHLKFNFVVCSYSGAAMLQQIFKPWIGLKLENYKLWRTWEVRIEKGQDTGVSFASGPQLVKTSI